MNNPSGGNEIAVLRQDLVEKLVRMGSIKSPKVEEAFQTIPRHLFTPGIAFDKVYSDNSIPFKRSDGKLVSSSSQPAIMANMLEQLQLQTGDRVLEIGAGTGYNAGLMGHIVGDSGLVVTMDIDEDIVESAREHLRSAGLENVKVVCGDGGLGHVELAPYDKIILTVGAWDITPSWWEQLKPDGRLLLPLEINRGIQYSIAFDKKDTHLESVSVNSCSFMTLRGAFANPQSVILVGPEPGLSISVNEGIEVNTDLVYELLSGPSEDISSGIQAYPGEVIFGGLALWLSLREPNLCLLTAEGQLADRGIIPCFLTIQSIQKLCVTSGLVGDEGLCVFVGDPKPDSSDVSHPPEIFVRHYGRGIELAKLLIDQIKAWDAVGRPSNKGLCLMAYPKHFDYHPSPTGFAIHKRWTRLILDWK